MEMAASVKDAAIMLTFMLLSQGRKVSSDAALRCIAATIFCLFKVSLGEVLQ